MAPGDGGALAAASRPRPRCATSRRAPGSVGYPDGVALVEALDALAATHPGSTRRFDMALEERYRAIPVFEVAAPSARPQPTVLVVANLHPTEVVGSVAALALAGHVARAQEDPAPSPWDDLNLLVVPRVAMATVDEFLEGPTLPRGAEPGERPAIGSWAISDRDNDGRIVDVRYQHPGGRWRASTAAPDVLVRRGPDDEGPFYELLPEGGPGLAGPPPTDLNRNFPTGWRPHPWAGSGPLSAPEAQALSALVATRPEIVMACDLHSHAGCLVVPTGLADHPAVTGLARLASRLGHPVLADDAVGEGGTAGSFIEWLWTERAVPAVALELYGPHRRAGLSTAAWTLVTELDEDDAVALTAWVRSIAPDAVRPWRPAADLWPDLPGAEVGGIDRRFSLINPLPSLWGQRDAGSGKSGGTGMAHCPLSLDGLGGVATGAIGCDETSDGDMRLIADS